MLVNKIEHQRKIRELKEKLEQKIEENNKVILYKKKLILQVEIVHPYIDFDEIFSDIQTLEELPIDEILSTISSAQQTDFFCEPIYQILKKQLSP